MVAAGVVVLGLRNLVRMMMMVVVVMVVVLMPASMVAVIGCRPRFLTPQLAIFLTTTSPFPDAAMKRTPATYVLQ